MKKQGEKLSAYFGTILEIIEDKPSFLIPSFVYCLLIQILFQQIAGYIFSTYESKPLNEQKAAFIAHLNEIAPFSFLLFLKANDTLTLLAFGIMNFIMYFYFLYVGILTYLKKVYKYFYQQNKRAFQSINQFLNVFFTFYWWFFYTPYLEINSGIIVCSSNSFLSASRKGDCSGKPMILNILAGIGLAMAFITAVIIVIFFRNYEFNDQNYLKRRYNNILLIQITGRFFLTFLYYLDLSFGKVVKHFIAQGLALSFIYDIILNWPFNNHTVSRFFFCFTIIFEVSVILCHLWIFTDKVMRASEFFYFFVFISTVASSVVLVLWQFKYEDILKFDVNSFQRNFKRVDFFLEELVRLLADSQRNETSKFQLISTLMYHKAECKDTICHCQKVSTFLDAGKDVSKEDTYLVIDSIFGWSLKQRLIRSDSKEFEHLSLKYISYLAKYRNNTSRAYYELKILLSARSNTSFYFKSISKILSKTIEEQMEQALLQRTTNDSDDKDDMDLSLVWEMEQMKSKFVPTMIQSLKEKIEFWEKVKLGFPTMSECIAFSVNKIRVIQSINDLFGIFLNRLDGKQKNNYIFYKICSMFELLVKNQIVSAAKLEISAAELKKRDQTKPTDSIHNANIANQQIASFIVSFSKKRGKIISSNNYFLSRFFGFEEADKDNLQQINYLMPPFLASIHDELMENMNWKGSSTLIKGSLHSFCKDKAGFIYPVKVFLDHSFGHFDDFCLLSSILKIQNSNDYLLFDQTGKILGISQKIYQKLFSYDKKMTINNLCRKGFAFLLFQDILQDILNSSKEIKQMTIQDSNINLIVQKKASINLTLNFTYLFEAFQMFLQNKNSKIICLLFIIIFGFLRNQQTQGKQFDFKDAKTVYSSKFAVSSPHSMQESSNSKQIKSEMKSVASTNINQQLDVFSEDTKKLVSSFLDQYLTRKQYQLNNKVSISSGTSLYRQDSGVQIRLFFKYTLDYQILYFNKNQSKMKLFQLTFSDATVQKKKMGSGQSNPSAMSMLTYVNSGTFFQGQASIRGKSIHSKGNNTERHTNSSDERITPKGDFFLNNNTNNTFPKLDLLTNHAQPQNKLETQDNCKKILVSNETIQLKAQINIQLLYFYLTNSKDQDDHDSSNWTKVKDGNGEDLEQEHSQEKEKPDDRFSNFNMQQVENKDNNYFEPDYEDMGRGLENILEAPNKDEDSNKTKDQKNQSLSKQHSHLASKNQQTDSNGKIVKSNDSTKLYDNSKVQTGIADGFKLTKEISSDQKGSSVQRNPAGGNILPPSMISDIMMNENNAQLFNFDHSLISPDESSRNHGNSLVNQGGFQGIQANDLSAGGELLHSIRTDIPLYSDRQQDYLIAPMSYRNTDFFSPTNETTQQGYPLISNEGLVTRGEERTYGNIENPITLRFTSRNKTESQLGMTNQMTLEEQIGNAKANAAVMFASSQGDPQSKVESDIEQIFDLKNDHHARLRDLKKSTNDTNDAYQAIQENKDNSKKPMNQQIFDIIEKASKIKKKKYSLKDEDNEENENDEKGRKQSLASHTSIRSSYGTQYVKEIISSKRLPLAARKFNVIQQVFLGIFLFLTLMYILYLSTQITGIANNIAEFKIISNLINSYGKGLLGTIGLFSINQNLFNAGNVALNAPIFKQNVEDASEDMQLSFYELDSMLLSNSLNSQALVEVKYDYRGSAAYVSDTGVSSIIRLAIEALFQLKEKQILSIQSLLYLKTNYETFLSQMDQIRHSRDSQVSDLLYNVQNLFIIFTSLSCVFCLLIAITGLPLIHKMNIYKEKIILLVTRISFTDVENEVDKYKACLEQLTSANESYIHADFYQIFTSRRSKKFKNQDEKDLSRKNAQGKKKETKVQSQQLQLLSSASIRQNKFKQNIVSSAIQDQRLGLSKDFIGFFSTSLITIIIFSAILVYVINSYSEINKSLSVSQITDQAKISLGAFYAYSELLAVEQQLQLNIGSYPVVSLSDRASLYEQTVSHLNQINQFKEENLNTLYGSNIISTESLSILRNLYQTNLCLTIPDSQNCLDFPQGISSCLSQVSTLLITENIALSSDSFPSKSEVISYLNSDLHQKIIVFAYFAADEAITLFSNLINEANQKILQDTGHTVQLIFYIAGPTTLVFFLLFFLKQWITLKRQLTSLNFLLVLVPEDRLQDEIMLQMLKTLKSF